MYRLFEIRSSRQNVERLPGINSLRDKNVNDSFVKEIVSLPEGDNIRVQISDYISDKALRKLNNVFQLRPDIDFRIYGFGFGEEDCWNLNFLTLLPSVSKLSIDCSRSRDTDFTVLGDLHNLHSLQLEVIDVKDFSFLDTLPKDLENLHIDAEVFSGKPKFDCRLLLRFQSLSTLYLGHVEKNLDCMAGLSKLRKLTLRGGGAKDLVFLSQVPLEDLEISWCNASKVDWTTLQVIASLRSLTLFSIKKLEDVSFIASLPNLEILNFIWMGAVTRLPDLSCLTKLRVIDFDTCNKLVDVSGLVNVNSLETVRIFGNKLTLDAAAILRNNTSIKELVCNGYRYDPSKQSWICLYK